MTTLGSRAAFFALALITLAAFVPQSALAGRRAFLFTFDTEVLAQGDAELEQWIWGRNAPSGSSSSGTGWLWFSPVYGLLRGLEVAMPWEMVVTQASTRLTDFAFEARYKIFPDDPHTRGGIGAMIRAYYQLNFDHPFNAGRFGKPWLGADAVFSFGPVGGSHATIDLGTYMDAFGPRELVHFTASAGLTYRFAREWRVGGEYYQDLSLGSLLPDNDAYFAGPVVAFSRANVWITAGALIGLNDQAPSLLSRLIFGVNL